MSTRDEVAQVAMPGILAAHGGPLGYAPEEAVAIAFSVADAMQAEKKRRLAAWDEARLAANKKALTS